MYLSYAYTCPSKIFSAVRCSGRNEIFRSQKLFEISTTEQKHTHVRYPSTDTTRPLTPITSPDPPPPADTEADCISLRIPSLQISCRWPIRDIQSALATSADPPPSPLRHPSSPSPPQPADPQLVRKCSQPLLTRLSVLAEREVGGGGAVGGPEAVLPGISAFLFLYSQMVG